MFDPHQLHARGGIGLRIARRGDLAVAEETLGIADTAHLQAFTQLRFEMLADDEFRAATADIGHQTAAGATGEGM
ncbi:hypothetical protein D3C77_587230 [compost metagenome]